jgi:hypothetical protein
VRKTEGRRQLICVASDGVLWKTYRPRPVSEKKTTYTSKDVVLEPLRTIEVKEETLGDFWIWLTSLLFRPAQTDPSAERFRADFGATSLAFADAMEALKRLYSHHSLPTVAVLTANVPITHLLTKACRP